MQAIASACILFIQSFNVGFCNEESQFSKRLHLLNTFIAQKIRVIFHVVASNFKFY